MENNIDTIDLINAYINNTLSKTERLAFENRLQTDLEFNSLYNEHLTILEGIKRAELTNEIQAAKQSYIRTKWMKYIGISVGVIIISALVYTFVFRTETPQIVEPIKNSTIEFVTDSIVVEKAKEKTIVIKDSTETKIEEFSSKKEKKYFVVKKINYSVTDTIYGGVINVLEKEKIKNIGYYTISDLKNLFPNSKHLKPINDTIVVNVEAGEQSYDRIKVLIEEEPNTTKMEPTSPELKAFFKSVKKAPQIIEVNTEKDFTVTCKEGTKLTIPAKAFVEVKTGKLARGTINLEVTEYYKLSDMLLANLTTKSDDKQLETGGMLYLDANKKGSKLKLKSGKRIKMAFVNKGKKDMQLFSGEENSEGVNWRLQKQTNAKLIDLKAVFDNEIIEEDVEVALNVVENSPIYPGCENESEVELKQFLREKIENFVNRKFDTSIAGDSKLNGKIKMNTFFTIDKEGDITNIKVRTPNKALGDEMIRVLESLPELIPAMQRGRRVNVTFYLPFIFSIIDGDNNENISYNFMEVRSVPKTNTVGDSITSNIQFTAQDVPALPASRIANYAFSSVQLGWINCDRFVRMRAKKIKYKLNIKNGDGANVKMLFKSMSSILPSTKSANEYNFGTIPINEEVVLIAIKKKDGKLYFGKKETNTKTVLEMDLDFKEVTIEKLQIELQKLNSEF